MKNLNSKVSIIVPAFNEASHLVSNLEEVVRTFDDFGCRYEIVVVDDGSKDDTYEEALKVARKYKHIYVIRNRRNFGKGRALKKGFRHCRGEHVVFLDADMDLHPGQIQTFFDILRLDEADVVIGSKLHPNSTLDYPWHRKLISRVYFFLIKILFGLPIHDTQTGLKLFKHEVLTRTFHKVLIKQFAFDLELLVNIHSLGYKIAEAPVNIDSQRKFGRIGIKQIIETWWDTMAIFYRMYITGYYKKKEADSGVLRKSQT